MTYIVDTHILIWFLDKNKRLKQQHHQLLIDRDNSFVFPAIVLAEIKHLISRRRIDVTYNEVIEQLSESANCIIYPIDEVVIEQMPEGLDIHDALIVATGLIYKNILNEEVKILSDDKDIIKAGILPVVQ